MVVIIDPHIKRDMGYHIHSGANEKGFYVKKKEGGDYDGWCWPGSSRYCRPHVAWSRQN
jgi:alpha 1,3-glucosidase